MSRYPVGSALKAKLSSQCKSDRAKNLAEAMSNKFGGQEITCNRRVAQIACFEARSQYGCTEEECSLIADALCSYIVTDQCTK